MRREKKTSKDFCRDSETDDIFCIEKRSDGVFLGSCGPLPEDNLKDLDEYECTNKNNLWIQDISDRLMML